MKVSQKEITFVGKSKALRAARRFARKNGLILKRFSTKNSEDWSADDTRIRGAHCILSRWEAGWLITVRFPKEHK